MTLNEYQALARRTQNNELTPVDRREHALKGMCSEVGEIHGVYQKVYQGHEVNTDDVIKELGDVMWFVAEMADALGVDLDDVATRNIEKLRKRYPEGFDADKSINREE